MTTETGITDIHPGGCLCGNSQYEVVGRAQFAVKCYCADCRKVSGGGHLPQVAFSKQGFRNSGPVTFHRTTSEAGNELEFAFCADCGSPLFKYTSKLPEVVVVTAGSLEDPTLYVTQFEAFEGSRLNWDK